MTEKRCENCRYLKPDGCNQVWIDCCGNMVLSSTIPLLHAPTFKPLPDFYCHYYGEKEHPYDAPSRILVLECKAEQARTDIRKLYELLCQHENTVHAGRCHERSKNDQATL